jgi:transcriptional regulator with PAS, ATPase and Fis domain
MAKMAIPQGGSLQQALQTPEKQIIVQTLKANKGNRQLTAAQLGINRTTLYKKMKKYGLLD